MEEIKGILCTSTVGSDEECNGVRIKKELGVVVAIDNGKRVQRCFLKVWRSGYFQAVAFTRSKPSLYEIQSVPYGIFDSIQGLWRYYL